MICRIIGKQMVGNILNLRISGNYEDNHDNNVNTNWAIVVCKTTFC